MPRPTTVIPSTPLGRELERCRAAKGISRKAASEGANTSDVQWNRLLTEQRRFEPSMVRRAAEAVGLSVKDAFKLAGIAIVPDGTSRIITVSEWEQLQEAS